jgi:ABC-2 type transport system ATP-binding protein
VLLLDEPTDGLDLAMRTRALSLLAEHLADTPATVLMSTHQIHEVDGLADHMGVLRDGRLVAQMSRDEIQRTVRRYRAEVPELWQAPPDLQAGGVRSSTRREMQWTLIGDERAVVERLTQAGALVREVSAMTLEAAALALLTQDVTR